MPTVAFHSPFSVPECGGENNLIKLLSFFYEYNMLFCNLNSYPFFLFSFVSPHLSVHAYLCRSLTRHYIRLKCQTSADFFSITVHVHIISFILHLSPYQCAL